MAAVSGDGNLRVVVRVRPFSSREVERNAECVVRMIDDQTIITPPRVEIAGRGNRSSFDEAKSFGFDKSYWSFDTQDSNFSGQDDVFQDLGKPLLDNAFQGYNNCILAYGQTGSGKSYSMMGYGAEPGIIPKICKDMFKRIDVLEKKDVQCTVEVSYLEIYNERVRDLLNPATNGNLRVREHPSTGPYVEDLAKLLVRSFHEIETLMDEGNKARTVAATNMNESSSRSHAVFILTLTQRQQEKSTKIDLERVAKISLVDLAGSERSNAAGTTGVRLKEGADINKSLSTLGRVIAALAEKPKGKRKSLVVIPYRDSVLTWMLKDSLGGNSMTTMIATISPADLNYEETLSTLRYADFAKRIKNHAVVNEDANARMIRELKDELAQLRSKLDSPTPDKELGDPINVPATPLEQQMISLTQPDGTLRLVSKADILEQLSQSEKLYQDLNQTWEQKLEKTETIQKEREAALEELGISIEKGFVGLSTPRRTPHLVNLSDDPLLAECLVYNLRPGDTTVGNEGLGTTAEVRLKGSKILKDHCIFQNVDGVVSVITKVDAAVMVNGVRVTDSKRLRSGYRIILGDFHIFRFNHPLEARAERASYQDSPKDNTYVDEETSPTRRPRRRASSNKMQTSRFPRWTENSPVSTIDDSRHHTRSAIRNLGGAVIEHDLSNLADQDLDELLQKINSIQRRRRRHSISENKEYSGEVAAIDISPDTSEDGTTLPKSLEAELEDSAMIDDDDDKEPGYLMASPDIPSPDVRRNCDDLELVRKQLEELRAEMESALRTQREKYESELEDHQKSVSDGNRLSAAAIQRNALARQVLQKWSQRRYARMAESIIEHTNILKKAQVLSQRLKRNVVFQFALIQPGQLISSSYDSALGQLPEIHDTDLKISKTPQLGVRVADFENLAIYSWSLSKLRKEVLHMELQLLEAENASDPSSFTTPSFSIVGEGQISLESVYQSRVQDFTVEIISPYTFGSVGVLRLSLEPSLAGSSESPKFNAIIHDLTGFSELEGSKAHLQITIPGHAEISKNTTQLMSGFGESKILFAYTRGISYPIPKSGQAVMRVSLFARITSVHLDKLLSWDDMRDASDAGSELEGPDNTSTIVNSSERTSHVFAQIHVSEISEKGEYKRTEVHKEDDIHPGTHQLHQGLQRRISVQLSHTCGQSLLWDELHSIRAGKIRRRNAGKRSGRLLSSHPDVILLLTSEPRHSIDRDGVGNVQFTVQWDSGSHTSDLLDQSSIDNQQVEFDLSWVVNASISKQPLDFSLSLNIQIHPRQYIRPQSRFSGLWGAEHLVHSTAAVFAVTATAVEIPYIRELERAEFRHEPVEGEEILNGWAPRGISLIRDYVGSMKQEETNNAAAVKRTRPTSNEDPPSSMDSTQQLKHTTQLLDVLQIWKRKSTPQRPTASPSLPTTTTAPPLRTATTFSTYRLRKSPQLAKSGNVYLPSPHPQPSEWLLHHIELRPPFLHVYALPSRDQVDAICLEGSRVDHQPKVAELLGREVRARKGLCVFALYWGEEGRVVVCAVGSEKEKAEWILRLDEVYSGMGG